MWSVVENEWTLPRYYIMQDYWAEECPPLAPMVAGFMGWKPRPRRGLDSKVSSGRGGEQETGNLYELMRLFPGGSIQ